MLYVFQETEGDCIGICIRHNIQTYLTKTYIIIRNDSPSIIIPGTMAEKHTHWRT